MLGGDGKYCRKPPACTVMQALCGLFYAALRPRQRICNYYRMHSSAYFIHSSTSIILHPGDLSRVFSKNLHFSRIYPLISLRSEGSSRPMITIFRYLGSLPRSYREPFSDVTAGLRGWSLSFLITTPFSPLESFTFDPTG